MFPQGNPQYRTTCHGNGRSGPCAAAGWSGEATLDVEWAYAIAPEAKIVLLAVPPAETLGVQGFPNLFEAISHQIDATAPGTVFSMSFAMLRYQEGVGANDYSEVVPQHYGSAPATFDGTGVGPCDTYTVNPRSSPI